jgi:hypothetical protein
MTLNQKKLLLTALIAGLLLCLILVVVLVIREGEGLFDRENIPEETFIPVADGEAALSYSPNLSLEMYPIDTPTGGWLDGCADSDRNDSFDAYLLRHESDAGTRMAFTYLIYYPAGNASLKAPPAVLENEKGFRVDVELTSGTGEGKTLIRMVVELPTDVPPRIRLLLDGKPLDILITGTDEPIPLEK